MTLKSVIKFNQNNIYQGLSSNGYGGACFAKKDFNAGEVIIMGIGKIINHQTPTISIQIGVGKHFQPTKWTGRYWNHSCNPNTFVKTRTDGFPNLVALRRIKREDEITYSYAMTEYSWCKNAKEKTILCKCNNKKCKGKILSFSQLSKSEQKRLVKKTKCSLYLKKLV
ncbi:MAG: SET domain-containing protein-lysine N-methyltransferase [Candidatus Zambryskibacteria bacterium]|nr:SET domain-containing protein-lysine N-methyltransferase [Candidatus Zambryskibacteria bacterium]